MLSNPSKPRSATLSSGYVLQGFSALPRQRIRSRSLIVDQRLSSGSSELGYVLQYHDMRQQIKKREIVSESVYPVLDVRFVGGLRRVREMTDSHQFEPVIPSYNYMDTEQASDYYTSSTRGGARLPIITGYELLRRCSQVECEKVKVTLNIDGLPSYNGPLDDSAPANTSAPSPCKPPAHTCQPLVLESYHEWLRKDSGLEK